MSAFIAGLKGQRSLPRAKESVLELMLVKPSGTECLKFPSLCEAEFLAKGGMAWECLQRTPGAMHDITNVVHGLNFLYGSLPRTD